ncbi:tungstate transport system substrate-binding protein [Nannocystis exedens]|uniref:Tungstate transport system substrate-binding protein n=1 Tax=Nannocystis exedens TaxID=54 RepID=A0A1I1Y7N1_9BACT|nr:substrate-binding domain-containing protein [Nannocystis exedens]PCC71876.1 PBP superfamily domain protein [Nannocystis exedens]SFE15645.1 tungstate transport system substrate-binding protein [Nannocystis exedens]
MWTRRAVTRLVWPLGALVACGGGERARPLRLAVTTSVHDSGLMGVLVPAFTAARGRPVEVVPVGSKRAIELLATGQADAAITHSPVEEAQALASGRIGGRTPVMRNAYVLVGPVEAAGVVAGAADIRGALRAVAGSGRRFVSRGDDSGTHPRELQLWAAAGVPAESAFILHCNGGMAEALELAAREHAFILSDRATFLARRGDLGLAILFQGGSDLDNIYAVLEPAPDRGGDLDGARAFAEFLRSPTGRGLVGSFGVDTVGEPLFTPVE